MEGRVNDSTYFVTAVLICCPFAILLSQPLMSQIFILDLGSRTTQVQRCARLRVKTPMLITPSLSNYPSISDDNDDNRNKHWFSKTSSTAECLLTDLLASLTHCKDGKCYKSLYSKIKICVLRKPRTSSIFTETFPVHANCNIGFLKAYLYIPIQIYL